MHRAFWICFLCVLALSQERLTFGQEIRSSSGFVLEVSTLDVSTLADVTSLPPVPQPPTVAPSPPIPGDLPLPPDVVTSTPRPESPLPHTEVLLVPSPAASPSFQGLPESGSHIPPDTMGAVGPNHVMTALNDRIRFQTRSGITISTVTLDAFWASLGSPDAFDPRLVYDRIGGRWIFTATANLRQATSAVLIGASQTSDPTGTWNLYTVEADAGHATWADFPSIGFNGKWVVVQVNMYANSNDAFVQSNVIVFDKADLFAGVGLSNTVFSLTTFGGVQAPAHTMDNSSSLYLLQHWNGNSGGNGYLRLYEISGNVGSESLSAIAYVTAPAPWAFTVSQVNGGFAPQTGTTTRIDNNDSRMLSVVHRNGKIWGAQTVFLPVASPTHTAVQWWQIDTSGTVLQRGRIEDPSATQSSGNFFAFPNLAVNTHDDMLIGYSRFSASQYASANYSFRSSGDAANTVRDDVVLQGGLASYTKDFGSGRVRWGDYSATVVDPANDIDMWTLQEYADTPSSKWATWWGRIVPPSGLTDDPLVAGTTAIKAIHITELRTRIDAARAKYGRGAYSWTGLTAGSSIISAVYITELRTALLDAYTAGKITPQPTFTDSSLAGVTVKAVHITEIRAAVVAIE